MKFYKIPSFHSLISSIMRVLILLFLGFALMGCGENEDVEPKSVVSVTAMAEAGKMMPVPVWMYLFDRDDLKAVNYEYGPELAVDSAYGQVWKIRLPDGGYRVEVFDGAGFLPSGKGVHWMNGFVDFSARGDPLEIDLPVCYLCE